MRLSHSQVTRAGDEKSSATPQGWVKGLRFKWCAMERSRNADALPYGKRAQPKERRMCLRLLALCRNELSEDHLSEDHLSEDHLSEDHLRE
jgi:hypothetical protein